ncbi:nitronate monooxygenase family protein [Spongiactinospora sp. TRM90649]|uniref:NAD(P)H-dependent flavin oxidoreductase n=1 Tax=Spongiactinospora sp. TRM90649 TaxID=3031114 RepID=UPI0023F7FF57|nr:nitronate monooxygenase family protein [Spongiactinospora sp. TRM90649]MDF5755934.1 nitronate monooxygenase family protein [Spongiactinospora sp. TRM90649]
MRTAICERLGVEHPLLAFSPSREVVAAVTRAGGFGVLGASGHSPDRLDSELSRLDEECGGRPYGVAVVVPEAIDPGAAAALASVAGDPFARVADLIPERHRDFVAHLLAKYGVSTLEPLPGHLTSLAGESGRRLTNTGATTLAEVALKHPIGLIACLVGGPPPDLVTRARAAGVPVAAFAHRPEHALPRVAAGADLIVAQGTEAGGHTGEITTMVLVPQVVDAVDVPVLAAGGIASGRQMAAALALGAEGVWCGSVWLGTEEACVPPAVRRKILAATSADTVRSTSRTGEPARQLRSSWTDEWDEATESPGALPMPLQALVAEGAMARIGRAAEAGSPGAERLANDFAGQAIGQLDRVRPAREVFAEMIEEYGAAVRRLRRVTGP